MYVHMYLKKKSEENNNNKMRMNVSILIEVIFVPHFLFYLNVIECNKSQSKKGSNEGVQLY